MTGTDILAAAEKHLEGDIIDPVDGLMWLNECMVLDLGADGRCAASTVVVAEADTWVNIPSDLLEVFEILKAGSTTPYWGRMYGVDYTGRFDLRNGQIRFPDAGTYTIWHYRVPPVMSSLAETPAVHAVFHWPMSLYIASRFKSNDDEENQDAQRLMTEWYAARAKALKQLAKLGPTTRKMRRINVPQWM